MPYLRQIVVGATARRGVRTGNERARSSASCRKNVLLWNDGPRMRALFRKLEGQRVAAGPGKGPQCLDLFRLRWPAERRAWSRHDCDILTYSRGLLAQLCCSGAFSLGFDSAGYYPRVTDRLNGRVMRLLVTPLIRALRSIVGPHPFLVYMDAFRYPLAGEFALEMDLVRRVRIPGDWALEVGLLAEVFRNCAPRAICQSELCETYDHKHQELSPRDAEKGLNKMATDITRSFFRRLAAEGIQLDAGLFDSLLSAYVRQAEDTLRCYAVDSAINGLMYPRHDEESAVNTFVRSIQRAAEAFQDDPLWSPLIPNWNRVETALPSLLDDLREAVQRDNA